MSELLVRVLIFVPDWNMNALIFDIVELLTCLIFFCNGTNIDNLYIKKEED
jgi:hypothetical protein